MLSRVRRYPHSLRQVEANSTQALAQHEENPFPLRARLMDWGQLYVDMQMNNVYKSVRNEALGAFVAVPANSPTRDKRSGRIAASGYALCANTHQHEKSTRSHSAWAMSRYPEQCRSYMQRPDICRHQQHRRDSSIQAALDQAVKAKQHDKHVALRCPLSYNLFRGVEQSGSSSGS